MLYAIFINGTKNAFVRGPNGQINQAVFTSEAEAIQALSAATARDFNIHIKHAENRIRKHLRDGKIAIKPCVLMTQEQYTQNEKFINLVIQLIIAGKLTATGVPSFGDFVDILGVKDPLKQRDPKPAVGPLGNAAFPKTTQLKVAKTRGVPGCTCPRCRGEQD